MANEENSTYTQPEVTPKTGLIYPDRNEFNLYVVELGAPRAARLGYDGHALTTRPQPGDRIAYTLKGYATLYRQPAGDEIASWEIVGGGARLETLTEDETGDNVVLKVEGCLTRGPRLGEDSFPEGGPELASLWVEALNGAEWKYAPVVVTAEPDNGQEAEQICARYVGGRWEVGRAAYQF